ncbi:MAG TPA: hypothetical protein VEH29_06005 [Acidimicrobiales bacterium]|nr:hypothetical protein [Acidimicrobiales bacterium]
MSDTIEAAHAPFVASLRAGSFKAPEEGWPAELIGAHVAVNNQLIAEVAERVGAGDHPSYDNAVAVDEAELQAFADAAGGLGELADAVERSAARLAAAHSALSEEQASTLVQAVIHDGGTVVVDRPMAVGSLCEGNAGFHLENHREQLRALEVPAKGEPPAEFDRYELVVLMRPESVPELPEEEVETLQSLHLGYFAKMRALGYLLVPGPLRGESGEAMAGICLYGTGSREKTRLLAQDDPAVRAGRLVVKVLDWYTAKGALSIGP